MIPDKEVPASINAKEVELITLSGGSRPPLPATAQAGFRFMDRY